MKLGHQPRTSLVAALASRGNPGEHVLIEQEERLDRANVAPRILDDEIPIREFRLDRPFDDFVVAVVFALTKKRIAPMPETAQIGTRRHFDRTPRVRLGDGKGGWTGFQCKLPEG